MAEVDLSDLELTDEEIEMVENYLRFQEEDIEKSFMAMTLNVKRAVARVLKTAIEHVRSLPSPGE